ncbi:MAG: UDP-N-acetylmuramate dehydrogenase [Bacteroidota bacterium]
MKSEIVQKISASVQGIVASNEPLAKHTSFRIGGSADVFIEPKDYTDAVELILFLKKNDISFTMLGNGSNVLVSDNGIRNVVINMESGLHNIIFDGKYVTSESGVLLNRFVDFCIQREFAGVEMLAGIPGTIGGAIVMNAGAHNGEISDFLIDVEIMRGSEITIVSKKEAEFQYRNSALQNDVVLSARFEFPKGNKDTLITTRKEMLQKRNSTQPLDYPNSGSVFKNPKPLFAARLIEEAGLKGTRIGDAEISQKHANFIINHGNAKASDVLSLMKLGKKIVKQKFNISLHPEVKLIGFSSEELQGLYE